MHSQNRNTRRGMPSEGNTLGEDYTWRGLLYTTVQNTHGEEYTQRGSHLEGSTQQCRIRMEGITLEGVTQQCRKHTEGITLGGDYTTMLDTYGAEYT